MTWETLIPIVIAIITSGVAGYSSLKLTKINADQKLRSDTAATKIAADEQFRNDLMETIRNQNEVQQQMTIRQAELQRVVDEERVKRRMQENENDYLVRQISSGKAEKDRLLEKIEVLEQRVLKLEKELDKQKERVTNEPANP